MPGAPKRRIRRQLRGRDERQHHPARRPQLAAQIRGRRAGQHRVSAKTLERYAEIVRKHLTPALGSLRLAKLSPVHVRAYYSDALTKGRVRTLRTGIQETLPPLAARTVKHHHRVLSEALRRAVRLRLLQHNPCDDVDPPRPKRREMKIIDQARSAQLLRAPGGKAIFIPVLLAITTVCGAARFWPCGGRI